MTLRLRTLGSVYLTRDDQLLSGAASQRRLLAILTVLAAVGERGISRDKLLALLWAEGEPDKSRHALTQSLYHIRKALGVERIFLSGSDLRLNPDALASDIADFQQAIRNRWFAEAVDLYGGPFLDGFYLNGDPAFDFWVSSERDRIDRAYGESLVVLADEALAVGDHVAELRWRTKLADHDPLSAAAIAGVMSCLITAGDRASAFQRALAYESRMRDELDLPPDRSVVELVSDLRRSASTVPFEDATSAAPTPSTETPVGSPEIAVQRARGRRPFETPKGRRRTDLYVGAMAASIVAVAIITRAAASRLASNRAATVQSTIVVAPFQVRSDDPSAAYLREGLLDLLTTRVADADTMRAADPERVLRAWRSSKLGTTPEPPISESSRLARQLGAGEVITGWLESSTQGVVAHASLIDATRAKLRSTATVRGSTDSLVPLADRIITGLILREAGERIANQPQPQALSPMALRAYLNGRGAYRRGDYHSAVRAFDQAVAQAPDFARAALGLAMSADRANAAEQHDRGLAIAWAKQDELSPADRAFLRAFAGPRYPEPSSAADALAAWERVVHVAPDRAEGWHELGESFYYDAEMLGMRDGPARAEEAFRRALALDSGFGPSRRMLALLYARQGDTASLRRLLASDSPPDTADAMRLFVRWRAANALGDTRALARVRGELEEAPNPALRAIAETSQFDGVSVGDGDRALAILRRRALSDAEQVDVALARHSRALNSGDYTAALAVTTDLGTYQPALHPHLRLRVLDALYSHGVGTAAAAAAATLDRLVERGTPQSVADTAVRLADLCVLGQWRLARGDTTGARAVLRPLRTSGAPRFPVPVGANPMSCAELIDVSLAIAEHGENARDRLAHLDSLMLSGPAVGDAMRYANLVVARQYQTLGDPRHALAALRRRSYMRGWPRYRATGLELLIQLNLSLGDTAAATAATRRLLATRH
jgi:DNA-binding SARP family transcriptional activator/TolB-like protein